MSASSSTNINHPRDMSDALADRSNVDPLHSPPAEMIGPKNRLLREHELAEAERECEDIEVWEEEDEEEEDHLTGAETDGVEEAGLLQGIDYISAAKLQAITGQQDLSELTYLEAQVDTESTSLSDIGNLLPSLTQLRLSHSNIGSLRDLGTSLRSLRVLWLCRAGLLSLDGLGSISETIEELYIAFNHVSDLSPIADDDFEALRILDADSNEIDDLEQVEFLSGCKKLHSLTLENNPVASAQGYVVFIRDTLPNIELLDDIEINQDRALGEQKDDSLTEVEVVTESIKLSRLGYNDVEYLCGASVESKVPVTARPASARPGTAGLLGTAMARPGSSGGIRPKTPFESSVTGFGTQSRPSTALSRLGTARLGTARAGGMGPPGTGMRPGTASMSMSYPHVEVGGSSSDLTFGSAEALCGGISRALRSRQRDIPLAQVASASAEEDEMVSMSALSGLLPGDREQASTGAEGESVDILQINYDDSSDNEDNEL